LVGNGLCNDETNNANCNYDGGDCCVVNANTNSCSYCGCYLIETCAAGYHPLVGNGFCNDETNIAECEYDGGDCCVVNANTNFCSDCDCHLIEICAAGYHHPLVGNGFCNDETNIAECEYDGGDCCVENVNTNFCSDCGCHLIETCAAGYHPLVGNGFCNDETNVAGCYDGGECCVNVNRDACSDCNCLGSGVITSPGFPGDYDNNLDLTWLIQVEMVQTIEINFLSFDVEYQASCR
jgi:hypothetical protein